MLHTKTRKDERGAAPIAAPAASSVRRLLIAKTRNRERTTKSRRRPLMRAPARPADLIELFVGSPQPWRTEPPGEPTKTNAPNPPRIRSLPADGSAVFRVFAFSRLCPHPPAPPHLARHIGTAPPPPPFVLSCFRVRFSLTPPAIARPSTQRSSNDARCARSPATSGSDSVSSGHSSMSSGVNPIPTSPMPPSGIGVPVGLSYTATIR